MENQFIVLENNASAIEANFVATLREIFGPMVRAVPGTRSAFPLQSAINLQGAGNVRLFATYEANTAQGIYRTMTGENAPAAIDAIKATWELLNIVAGNLIGLLSEKGLELDLSAIKVLQKFDFAQASGSIFTRTLELPVGPLQLIINWDGGRSR